MAGYFFAFLLSEVLFDNLSDHSGYEKLQLYQLQVNPLLINLAVLFLKDQQKLQVMLFLFNEGQLKY